MPLIAKYLLAWLGMVVIAIANGALREATYAKQVAELTAHQLSTLLAAIFFGGYIWGLEKCWPLQTASQALSIGLAWLAMTVAFEFLFGHFVAGHSWPRLLRDYNLLAGRMWLPLLLWVALAPWFFFRLTRS